MEEDRVHLKLARSPECDADLVPPPCLHLYGNQNDRRLGWSTAVVRRPRCESKGDKEGLEVALLAVRKRPPMNLHHLRRRLHGIAIGKETGEGNSVVG